jgi:hypothetical protein
MEYIIVKVEPNTATPPVPVITGYWDGTQFQSNIDVSDVQDSLPNARFLQASVQTQDTSFDVQYRRADVTVVLI